MNSTRLSIVVSLLSTLAFVQAAESSARGPFGLQFGMALKDLQRLTLVTKMQSANTYVIYDPPVPNPAFSWYGLSISPLSGLCSVEGIGKSLVTTGNGVELQEAYNGLKAALTRLYGPPTSVDETYNVPTYMPLEQRPMTWMDQLIGMSRTFSVSWSSAFGAALPQGTALITLDALGQRGKIADTYTGEVMLSYRRPNVEVCWAEREPVDPSGL